jgi:eukaryotic-like serine/threonine-protein kinase
MAKRIDVNDRTVDLPLAVQANPAEVAVPPADGADDTARQEPRAVCVDATMKIPSLQHDDANGQKGQANPALAMTFAIGDPKETVPRGEAAGDQHLGAGATHRLENLAKIQNDHTVEQPSALLSPPSATLNLGIDDSFDTGKVEGAASPAKHGNTPVAIPKVPGFEILGELGRGGMGVVYKARQAKLNRLVALKMVLAGAHASPDQLARFYTEAEAVASLQHVNIVQIFEVGEFEGLPFFSLEYVDGGMLSNRIDGKPRPPREAAETLVLLASAMAVAHECGIVHRDLKPTNVLLTRDGLPKITDFGLAKRLEGDSSQTKSGTLMGSPSYMSPEQARGETREIGTLSDLYSLGAILYELLTGRPPFVGPTVLETIMLVRNQEPVPPTRLQPKCPRDLETICLKCLQKEPSQRYSSCQKLADDLHHFLAGEPIKARPVSWIEHCWRWWRRNPRVASLSACVAVLLLAVIVSLGVMAVRLSREREAVAKTRDIAGERLEQATRRIAAGNYQQAQDILQWSDPLLSHDDLADVRVSLATLGAQVDVYAQCCKLLDSARFACRFGSRRESELGRDYCQQLLVLYDEIQQRTGRGASGMPPLGEEQQQLFKEDKFEALLTAAQVERELAVGADEATRRQVATKALGLLNRADGLLPGTRALLVQRAPCWAELGDAEAERADLEKAKTIAPTSAVDHFWHGYANHRRGDKALAEKDGKAAADFYRKEIAEYAAFLQQRPDHFWGYFNWANARVQLGGRDDLYDALIGFTACIRFRPDFPWPYNNRGTVHLRLGQHEMAALDFSAALERNANYPEAHSNRGLAYLALKKTDWALEDFTKAIALTNDAAEAYAARAEIYRERKQYALAAEDYTRLLALTENKGPILEKRAAIYRVLNKTAEAVLDYGELIKLNPSSIKARGMRAQLFLAQGKFTEARDDFTAVLEMAPTAVEILRARAIVSWQNLKDFDAALADFERITELAPMDAEPYRCIGAILLGRRRYADALEAIQKAVLLRPGFPQAIWVRAQIYQRHGQFEEALKELDPLVAKLPEGPPDTLTVRAGVYQAQGKLNEAAADFRRMIDLKPKEPEPYVCLARIYEKQGQTDKAAACLDQLVSAAPESKWSFARRAEFRRDRGDFDAADADCDRAAALAPSWSLPALISASVTAARGDPLAAVAQAKLVLEKAPPDDGHVLYAAACVWSLAAGATKDQEESNRFAEKAADYLTQALDKGFHDLLYPEHNRMADEPALARIRQLPRVRELLTGQSPLPTQK